MQSSLLPHRDYVNTWDFMITQGRRLSAIPEAEEFVDEVASIDVHMDEKAYLSLKTTVVSCPSTTRRAIYMLLNVVSTVALTFLNKL